MKFGLIFVSVCLLGASKGQETKEEEVNPFVEAARSLLQDSLQNNGNGGLAQGLGAVGGMIQGFMQTEGGRQIGDMLTGGGKGNDLLSGLGSLLTNAQGGQRSAGGIDPQLIGQMVDMFAGKGDVSGDEKDNEVQGSAKQGLDWESMISFATNMMASQNGGGNGAMEGFLNLLPVLMQSVNGGHVHQEDPELEDAQEHKRHQQASSFLPPFLSHLYVYWEHFKASELGQTLWTNSGLGAIMQLFTDKDGRFQVDRIFESMENTSFRKRWIRSLTSFIAEWVKYVSDPATQKRYLSTMQFVGNGFLKAQGYSKAVLFDPIRPAESLSLLANAVFKRQFGLKVDSAKYIKPAVAYIQDVFRLGQSKGLSLTHLTSQDIEGKLAETLNSEVIEPILRVWRAYRYAVKAPQCDRYLICTINRHPAAGKPGQLKPGVTKLASLTASWFLSGHTGTPFWKLYNAAVDENNCVVKYPVDCSGFHEEDIRVTTEYSHSEL